MSKNQTELEIAEYGDMSNVQWFFFKLFAWLFTIAILLLILWGLFALMFSWEPGVDYEGFCNC